MVAALETDIDFYMDQVDLPPKFVIPGGTVLSAQLDTARAVLRRAERRIAALPDEYELTDSVLMRYVNRASDLLFAMARYADERNPELFEGRSKRSGDGR
jgi:cob(I)alamin adenosyltransferase